MFGDIKQAYYGGVTEVYRPYGTNLLHYDVNSLYLEIISYSARAVSLGVRLFANITAGYISYIWHMVQFWSRLCIFMRYMNICWV